MGRPSMKEERTEQVLQAFQRCVAHYGLDGSTLERIAEESGLQRSLVRHFTGNRDDLVRQLADRVVHHSNQQWEELMDALPDIDAVPVFLDYLFAGEPEDPELMLVIASLTFAAGQDEHLRKLMQNWMTRFINDIASILGNDHPEAAKGQLSAVAFGIASLYLNLDSMAPLAMVKRYRNSAKTAAKALVSTLHGTKKPVD